MNNLRACRERAGLTRRQLANTLGISIGDLRLYERGQKVLAAARAFTMEDLARILDCTVEDLTTRPQKGAHDITGEDWIHFMAHVIGCPEEDLIDPQYDDHDDDEEEFLV